MASLGSFPLRKVFPIRASPRIGQISETKILHLMSDSWKLTEQQSQIFPPSAAALGAVVDFVLDIVGISGADIHRIAWSFLGIAKRAIAVPLLVILSQSCRRISNEGRLGGPQNE